MSIKRLMYFVLGSVLSFGVASLALAGDSSLRFVMVSHIGPFNPSMKWFSLSLQEFERRYPEVETEYIATKRFDLPELIQLTEEAVASKPDGLAVPIVNATAMEPVLFKAIAQGIPVIAFNIPDGRGEGERIPYLTYVGGDEYRTGLKLGEHTIKQFQAGKIPKPVKALCIVSETGHEGLIARCRGMRDAMFRIGATVEILNTGAEPVKAHKIIRDYLIRNKEVNYIFAVTIMSAPWAWQVAHELGREPDADNKGMSIITVDATPISLEGIKQGKILATHSQGFWLQGFIPMQWLYWHINMGYEPPPQILTGPVVISRENLDTWEKNVRAIFGAEYDRLADAWDE